jgi:integrase
MPQVIKRANSKYYYARFQVNGKDRWVSTGETDRKKAQQQLVRLRAQARQELSIEQQLQIITGMIAALPADLQGPKRQQVARLVLQGQEKKLALEEAWKRWLANPNKEYEPKDKTLLGYEAIWKRFKCWSLARHTKFLHEVTAGDAENYASDLWKSKVSASTYNQHIKFLRSLFTALEVEAGLVTNPWARITSTKKSQQGGRRNLSAEELKTVLERAQDNMRLLFIIGTFTGLRLADVVNLKTENIEYNPYPPDTGPRPGFIVVKPKKTERVNKIVDIPLHPSVTASLRDLKAKRKEGFLFPKEQALHAKNPSELTSVIQQFFEGCGIKTTEEIGDGHRRRAIVRVGFHSLRHTFVSMCAKSGAQLHVIQKIVGHGNPMLTSDKYLHLDRADKQAAIQSLPPLGFTEHAADPARAKA